MRESMIEQNELTFYEFLMLLMTPATYQFVLSSAVLLT